MTRAGIPLRLGRQTKFGVVILGAGASFRMGRPKLLLPWEDTSVVGHLIHQWKNLGARQLAVVCAPASAPLQNELDRLEFPTLNRIVNPAPEHGMFSSIRVATRWNGWASSLTAWAIVLGDQPHLRVETLSELLAFHRAHPSDICQPSYEGRGRHPVILPRTAWRELRETDAHDLGTFLKQTAVAVLKCPIDDPGLALDIDTPSDYKRALRLREMVKPVQKRP